MKSATLGRGFVWRDQHHNREGDGNTNATLGGSIHDDPLIAPSQLTLFQVFFNNSGTFAMFAARCALPDTGCL
jgi:hypothetical protein